MAEEINWIFNLFIIDLIALPVIHHSFTPFLLFIYEFHSFHSFKCECIKCFVRTQLSTLLWKKVMTFSPPIKVYENSRHSRYFQIQIKWKFFIQHCRYTHACIRTSLIHIASKWCHLNAFMNEHWTLNTYFIHSISRSQSIHKFCYYIECI